ncbi:sugar phosphate isomerase/epimerase family protein [Saccharobesus litoralis]|nr:sugar phosphate isomerase/epimerase [Saccharobesus litoralis]
MISLLLSACNITSAFSTTKSAKAPPISVQLWSVREGVKQDFKGSLKRIAAMGYQGVEFAGDYGPFKNDPEGLKAFLASLNLVGSGAHVNTKIMQSEKLDETLSYLQKAGFKLVIIPIDGRAWQPNKIHSLTQDLTKWHAKAKQYGLKLAYHNHHQEFRDFKGSTFWDYIAQNTPNDLMLQLDIGWTNYSNKDPIEYVKRYPNRTIATHIKIRTQGNTGINTIIGQDNFDWTELVKTFKEHGGTEWLVIEQEEWPQGYDAFSAIEASKKGLETFITKLP